MPLYPVLLTADEIIALRDALYRVEQPDATILDIRKRLTRMQAEVEVAPMREQMELMEAKLMAKMDALRRKLPPPGERR